MEIKVKLIMEFMCVLLGILWSSLQHSGPHMGPAPEGTCLYIHFQAIFSCNCSCYGCYISWWCSPSWEVCVYNFFFFISVFDCMFHMYFILAVILCCVFCLCSVFGAITLSLGFYSLMWGKAKEGEIMSDDCGSNNIGRTPLLPSNKSWRFYV